MIRRYTPIKPSRGTVIPTPMRLRVLHRDAKESGGCVGFGRFPVECQGGLELDHVRASHGMGLKSDTCDCNLVSLCNECHRWKTYNGRDGRGILLDYLLRFDYTLHSEGHLDGEHTHVEPVHGCVACDVIRARTA